MGVGWQCHDAIPTPYCQPEDGLREIEIASDLHRKPRDAYMQRDDPWQVRILPIVQMRIYPYRQDDWTPGFTEVNYLPL